MTVHLIKLCVGLDTLSDLAAWQAGRLAALSRDGRSPELIHVTRQTPKRALEVLDGGSLYWVIGGWIAARQKMLELRPVEKDGVRHCGLVYAGIDRRRAPAAPAVPRAGDISIRKMRRRISRKIGARRQCPKRCGVNSSHWGCSNRGGVSSRRVTAERLTRSAVMLPPWPQAHPCRCNRPFRF